MEENYHLPTTPIPFNRDEGDVLYIHFINTNEGDCIFLEIPEKIKSHMGDELHFESDSSHYSNILIDMGIGGIYALDSFHGKIGENSIHIIPEKGKILTCMARGPFPLFAKQKMPILTTAHFSKLPPLLPPSYTVTSIRIWVMPRLRELVSYFLQRAF